MTDEERAELSRLIEEKTHAEQMRYAFGFTNVANVHGDDLVALNMRGAELEIRVWEARAKHDAFVAHITAKAAAAAKAAYEKTS